MVRFQKAECVHCAAKIEKDVLTENRSVRQLDLKAEQAERNGFSAIIESH